MKKIITFLILININLFALCNEETWSQIIKSGKEIGKSYDKLKSNINNNCVISNFPLETKVEMCYFVNNQTNNVYKTEIMFNDFNLKLNTLNNKLYEIKKSCNNKYKVITSKKIEEIEIFKNNDLNIKKNKILNCKSNLIYIQKRICKDY